jgi:hypothetical protein
VPAGRRTSRGCGDQRRCTKQDAESTQADGGDAQAFSGRQGKRSPTEQGRGYSGSGRLVDRNTVIVIGLSRLCGRRPSQSWISHGFPHRTETSAIRLSDLRVPCTPWECRRKGQGPINERAWGLKRVTSPGASSRYCAPTELRAALRQPCQSQGHSMQSQNWLLPAAGHR